ncbi:pilS cassette protein [Neisseria meningitidis]|nr:pilS cassette protein [Neisseria meningitidis]
MTNFEITVCRNETESSFPRKWESRTRGLGNCFYPISFCADRSGFPPVRE